MFTVNQLFLGGFAGGAYLAQTKNDFNVLYAVMALYGSRMIAESLLDPWLKQNVILWNGPERAARVKHDETRSKSYPLPVANTWYRLCNSEDLLPGKVLEIRACGQVFAVWRTDDGTPVVQDAFCVHLGANLAVGGVVEDNCVKCPFHSWKFDSEGVVQEIPYLPKDSKCPTTKKLKTYPSKEWCGLICVYFHADGAEPEFDLPDFIHEDNIKNGWGKHLVWDIGFKTLTPIDWVDQTGDHAHFTTLHGEYTIPWTMIPFPKWFTYFFPMTLCHSLKTYLCDDKEWEDYVEENKWGVVDKHLIVFTDKVGLAWNGKPVPMFQVQTREMFAG
jgi:nitrite reductase/ring-hydroxylating ferredoxin subunit